MKNVVQPVSPNAEILANPSKDFAGKGVNIGKQAGDRALKD